MRVISAMSVVCGQRHRTKNCHSLMNKNAEGTVTPESNYCPMRLNIHVYITLICLLGVSPLEIIQLHSTVNRKTHHGPSTQ